ESEMFEKGRRSLHARIDIVSGAEITPDMICTKRPGLGLAPHKKHLIIGKRAKRHIPADQWILADAIEGMGE
ncbi:MAG: SAF domain-containing protein, partial [Rhodospirillales bacterium]|nr:SAF domain-containing protein [Rhodospirillales bacterium]